MAMSDEAKKQLIEGMDSRRAKAMEAITGIDPHKVVYPESGLRVKDLIAHLTAWEEEAALSLESYNNGNPYHFPYPRADIDIYNDKIYQARKELQVERIMEDWKAARDRLKVAVLAVPVEKFDGLFSAPWEEGPVTATQLVKGMGIHEKLHIGEIVAVK
jgi:hypothetical protein